MKNIWKAFKSAVNDFISDDIITSAAALGFYSALALAPLVLLFITLTGYLGYNSQATLINEFNKLTGAQGGKAIEMIISNADKNNNAGMVATIIGLVVLAFSASAVFGHIQVVLNHIFRVAPAPGGGIKAWLHKRLFSMGMVFSVGFLMIVSLIFSAGLSAVFSGEGLFWTVIQLLSSIIIFSLLFACIFKYMPDIKISWKDVLRGAVFTAVLFSAGHSAISFYLGRSALGSAYGAAGSLIVSLVWVYYSSSIVFFGAEFTKSFAKICGRGVEPAANAVDLA
jgi:membrane protein